MNQLIKMQAAELGEKVDELTGTMKDGKSLKMCSVRVSQVAEKYSCFKFCCLANAKGSDALPLKYRTGYHGLVAALLPPSARFLPPR